MSINHEVKVFSTVDFYENPEKTGDYLLKLEAAHQNHIKTTSLGQKYVRSMSEVC